ncbi:MAG: carboxypeptidase regulatory-like domain-containing protein, partial [Candidatus Cloacimonadaceae bacterium]
TVQVEADEMLTLDVNMQLLPGVMVGGRIIAYDTGGGLANAFVRLSGFANFLSSTDSEGYFSFPYVFAGESYAYLVSAVGYGSQVGNIAVGINDYYMGNIMLYETLYAPNSLIAGESENYDAVELNWNAPDPSAMELREGFEGEDFPPSGWSQIITNTSAASPQGVYPTWCRFGAVNTGMALVEPPEGSMQAGLWWMVAQQDEWLQTPAFICPPAAYLKFDTYATYGSNNGDHYYVKVSADGGESWAVLWDASAFPTATNYYENMISIDISNYAGQEILLAFHATDGGTYEGLWHPWFIDDIYIGNMAESAWQSRVVNANREIVGYRVWRLTPAEEQNEAAWTLLTPESINDTSYTDTDWDSLPYESYKWAVKAVYSGDLHSSPAFSNTLVKTQLTGTVVGMVRRSNGQGIPAAVVNCSNGESTTTNNSGAYSMILPIGTYSFSASANGYHPLSHDEIAILANQNITLNFNLIPLANQDDTEAVTATILSGNYPNPFNPETIISYELKDAASVKLEIYNLKGQLVRRLVNESQASGRYRIVFDAKDEHQQPLPSGIYLYRLNTGEYRKTRKMMLLQ